MGPLKIGRSLAIGVFVAIALHFAKGGSGANVSGQIYLTMPSVRLTVPIGVLPEGEPILRVQASSDVPKNPSEGKGHPLISYRLAKPSQMLRLDPNSGYLFLSERAKATEAASPQEQAKNDRVEEASIEIVSAVGASGILNESNHMLIQMATLLPSNGNNSYCEDMPQQALCFWDSFSFSIMENRPPTLLGELRPPFLQKLCPHYSTFYNIVEGSSDLFQVLHSPNKNWYLQTKYSFNREVIEWVEADVECHLNHTKDGSIIRYQRRINVTILDEDDCPPNAQITNLDINIHDPLVKKGDILNTGKLIMSDADTERVNIYKAQILEESDPAGLLHLTLHSWEVPARKRDLLTFNPSQIVPDVYESFGKTRSSAIHVGVTIAKTIKLTNPMYTTTFILRDTSLHGEQDKAKVTISLRLIVASQDKFEKDASGKNMGYEDESRGIDGGAIQGWRGNVSSFYPSTMSIQASASHFTRLAQPSLNTIQSLSAKLYPHGSPFAITPKKGIIYLKDPSRLHGKSLFNISVKWGTNSSTAFMTVKVEKPSVNCSRESQTVTCASTSLRRTCESMCGIGADGYCLWRKSPKDLQQGIFSTEYSTCSPELKTCPDGICDELEEIENKICPQDCARDFFGTVLQNGIEHNKGRGIKSGTGVCTCDDVLKCSCGPVTRGGREKSTIAPGNTSLTEMSNSQFGDQPHTPDQTTNEGQGSEGIIDSTAKVNNQLESCGESCFIAVVLGIVAAFVMALAGAIYARRRRKLAKQGCHQLSGMARAFPITIHPHDGTAESIAAATLGIQSQIYGQDDDNSSQMQELPLLTLRTNRHPDMPIDPKWELPRSSLQLEETLGEGEFGLVLRGKLKSPYGQAKRPTSPYITVAVKTLKEDAGEMERNALVSEFKLLQGVNHTNVVRLIGACTVPKDHPFLLVIEYAELGSLRNYLRKSRFATSDKVPLQRIRIISPSDNIHPKEACGGLLTPRHILSFAWQICKGMAYLSEIKLVHRDLAARNVLLSSNGNCKISDFGLTRDIYEDDTYFKRSKGRVPVKWMAPESLSDHIYTTQSDVWGFGVLLWELVTLGSTPYPGVPLTGLYSLLRGGYRMQKPQNCSDELYLVMLCCWKLEPRKRPTFQSLMASFERMLQDQVEYLQLGSIMAQNLTYFHSPTDETCHSPSDERVQYGNIRHDPVSTDHDNNAVKVPAAQQQQSRVELENAKEKTVEYTWLWRGKRISKRRWEDMHGVDGKNSSQGLLSEIEEIDEDSSELDSTPKSESDPALNEEKTNNEDTPMDKCPIKPTEQSECTTTECSVVESRKLKISSESPF